MLIKTLNTILKVLLVCILIGIVVYLFTGSLLKGVLTTSALLVLAWLFDKICYFMGMALESGFRNQFPNDFMFSLSWITNYFHKKGFVNIGLLDSGSEHPGVTLFNGKEQITIRLNAPLDGSDGSVDVYLNKETKPKWHFPSGTQDSEAYSELDKYFCEIHSDKMPNSIRLTNYYKALTDGDNT